MDGLVDHETALRMGVFAGVLLLMAMWEHRSPVRLDQPSRGVRWLSNIGLLLVGVVFLRVAFPLLAVGVALWAETSGFGVFNALETPSWIAGLACIVLLDLAIYGQHVALHRVPILWRLHRVHHSDTGFDVTTALRFHPGEIALSMLYKMAVVVALGAPAWAVIVFEVLLNAAAMFNHGNVRLPQRLEPVVRALFVTPDMHRVHHSAEPSETNSNYGFCLSIWDRLFRTYRAQSALGRQTMVIGVESFRTHRDGRLDQLLLQPFRKG